MKLADGSQTEIESLLAEECPQVDVAKLNHHGHHSMPAPLVDALKARVVLAGVWNERHLTRDTARRLAQGKTPGFFAPGLMPASRRKADAAEAAERAAVPAAVAAETGTARRFLFQSSHSVAPEPATCRRSRAVRQP